MFHLRPILTILALLVVLLLVVSISGREVEAPVVNEPDATTTPVMPGNPSDSGGIEVSHSFEGTTHTYSFDLYIPTPCHRLSEPDVLVRESFPEQIAIEFSVLPPAADVMCAQVISRVPVTAQAKASEAAVLTSIKLNGNEIDFVLMPRSN